MYIIYLFYKVFFSSMDTRCTLRCISINLFVILTDKFIFSKSCVYI